MSVIDEEFMEIVRCPVTRSRLHRVGDHLIAETGGLKYPIRDGIPVLLPEEAVLPEGISSLEEFRKKFSC